MQEFSFCCVLFCLARFTANISIISLMTKKKKKIKFDSAWGVSNAEIDNICDIYTELHILSVLWACFLWDTQYYNVF